MNKCYITVKVFCFLSLCSMPIVSHNNEHVWTLYLTYLLDYITTSSDIKRFYWGVKDITVIIKEVWYDIWIIYKHTKRYIFAPNELSNSHSNMISRYIVFIYFLDFIMTIIFWTSCSWSFNLTNYFSTQIIT